jgi:hypothetical protein
MYGRSTERPIVGMRAGDICAMSTTGDMNVERTMSTTMDMDVNGVGAMDVSWSEAQRAETNVIARSDDRATAPQRRLNKKSDDLATAPQRRLNKKRYTHSSKTNMCTFFTFCLCREHQKYVPYVPSALKSPSSPPMSQNPSTTLY